MQKRLYKVFSTNALLQDLGNFPAEPRMFVYFSRILLLLLLSYLHVSYFALIIALIVAATGPCTFENGMCGWLQDSDDDFNWRKKTGPTSTQFTGPSADHTVGTSKGNCFRRII